MRGDAIQRRPVLQVVLQPAERLSLELATPELVFPQHIISPYLEGKGGGVCPSSIYLVFLKMENGTLNGISGVTSLPQIHF